MPLSLFKLFLQVLTVFFSTMTIIVLYLTGSREKAQVMVRIWAKVVLKVSRVKLVVKGLEKVQNRMPCLFLSNHSSQFDIFAIVAALPFHFGFLAKEDLFEVPVFGEAMLRLRNLPIIREDKRKALATIKKAISNVKNGTNMVIYPEGTRSTTGVLLPFKPGAFHIAVGTGRPVVPVAISGAYKVQPREDVAPRPGTIQVRIMEPIDTAQFGRRDKVKLRELVYARIKDALARAEDG